MKILAIATVALVMCIWSIVDLLQFVASGQSVRHPLAVFILAVVTFFCFVASLVAFCAQRAERREKKIRGKT